MTHLAGQAWHLQGTCMGKKTSPDPKHLDRTMFSYKAEWSFPGKFTRNEFLEQQLHLVRIPLPWWGPWEDLLSPRVPRGHVETWLASCGFWFIQQKLEKKKATAFLSPFLLLLLLFFLVFLLSLLTFLFSSSFSPPPSFLLLLAVDAGWLKWIPLYIIFHKIFWIFKTYFHCIWDFVTERVRQTAVSSICWFAEWTETMNLEFNTGFPPVARTQVLELQPPYMLAGTWTGSRETETWPRFPQMGEWVSQAGTQHCAKYLKQLFRMCG